MEEMPYFFFYALAICSKQEGLKLSVVARELASVKKPSARNQRTQICLHEIQDTIAVVEKGGMRPPN